MPARFARAAKRIAKRIAKRMLGPPIFGSSILIYHRIARADFDPWNLAVLPDEFERQLTRMRSKTVLPLQQFAKLLVQRKLPPNAIAITFDDGYACNSLVAAPMLVSFGYPATFFVVSDAIARPRRNSGGISSSSFSMRRALTMRWLYACWPAAWSTESAYLDTCIAVPMPPSSGCGNSFAIFRHKNDAGTSTISVATWA
jgi:hypothetical protein